MGRPSAESGQNQRVAREEYYHDPAAPRANSLAPTAFAAVRDDFGRILLVRRADTGNWELPGGRVEIGESAVVAAQREVAEESGVRSRWCGWRGSTPIPATSQVPSGHVGVESFGFESAHREGHDRS